MSVKQMALVWEHEFPYNQQLIMLALTDHANDRGEKIFPSIARIAWKTGYGSKQTRRIMKELVENEILVRIRKHTQHRPNEYKIDWSKAERKQPFTPKSSLDKLSPQENPDLTSCPSRVDISDTRLDTAESPEPSLEPSIKKEKIEELPFKINPKLNKKLDQVKEQLKSGSAHNIYLNMIDPILPLSQDNNTLILIVKDTHHQDWAEAVLTKPGYLNIFRGVFNDINLKIKTVLMGDL